MDEESYIQEEMGGMVQDGEVPYDIRERLFQFAVKTVAVVRTFPQSIEGREIARQLLRSGTSMGANYEEAEGAQSRKDFIAKACISRKESRESRFWLRLVQNCDIGNKVLAAELHDECDQLVRILSTIISKASKNTAS